MLEISPDLFARAIGDAYKAGQESPKSFEQGYKEGQLSEVTRIAAALKRQDIWSTADLLKLIGAE